MILRKALPSILLAPIILLILPSLTAAQFQFFNNFFEGQQQQPQEKQNVASDSGWYQQVVENGTKYIQLTAHLLCPSICALPHLLSCKTTPFLAPHLYRSDSGLHSHRNIAHCTHYLCPGTLACVHFPHHCPCAYPSVEDKVELGDGIAICASKGGYKAGETARKIELARKGLL
ncbi:hypothetical protein EPUS_03019 [Endocarpon pusillum Z07020]|uniref:Long chronological lifespan protein 2 n=1 Tax=Endocarpon pusillum (strain Z07020 / HMAS-L-300199) TaxID=1263415 RepID=U1GLT5_ENDPU|nr:uncharacterized protein EPUS_03019 [Endocarpon pusillum Z07020]ERF73178.1 hypothetical protein EPUS_03019 [Endocarpon pusillum Z07020]